MKSRVVVAPAVALGLLCLFAGLPAAQQPAAQTAVTAAPPQAGTGQPAPQAPEGPPVTFRVEVNYVEVDAIVTDQQGNLVPGLTADDFELLEDKKPQKITAFAQVDIPIERAERPLFASTAFEPDVQTNMRNEGRVYLIVLDDLHTDLTRAPRVKAALHQFFQRSFGINDVAAIVPTSGRTDVTQEFTSNRRLLLAAVDRFSGNKLRGTTASRIDEFRRTAPGRNQGDPLNDPDEYERAYNAKAAMSRIRNLATFMAGVHGRRKAMLLIGEGIEYDITDLISNTLASGVLDDIREAIAAATRSNVVVYTIDPRGLAIAEADLIEFGDTPGSSDQSLAGVGSMSLRNELQRSQDSLRIIADETGGFAVLNQNDFSNAFERIVRENSSYYVMGYYPTNTRRDGKFRTISLRVKRPGLIVRARKGYVAARGRVAEPPKRPTDPVDAAVNEATASPLPFSGIPMQVFAAPYKGEAPNAAVAVALEFGVNNFAFEEKDGSFADKVVVSMTASNSEGKTFPGDRHVMTLTLRPDTLARAKTRGLRLLSQINLPPGRYQLRVGAAENGGKSGSVVADLEVPDFYKRPLTMSGVAVTAVSAGQTTTLKPKDPLAQFLPGPPTTVREFERGDQLALFAEFYENIPNAPPHTLDITTTIRAEDGHEVLRTSEEHASSDLKGGIGGFGFDMVIPLKDYPPGLYVIHVEGRSRGTSEGVGRDVQIRVR